MPKPVALNRLDERTPPAVAPASESTDSGREESRRNTSAQSGSVHRLSEHLSARPHRGTTAGANTIAARRKAFGAWLKAQREQQGIALDDLATATKVRASVFEALERGDLSRWPTGIYKRAYFRDYVSAIKAPLEQACQEFARLFPDGEEPAALDDALVEGPGTLRLTLAQGQRFRGSASAPMRLTAAAIDLLLVLLVGAILTWWWQFEISHTLATTAVCYHFLRTMTLGERLSSRWLARR